MNKGLLTVRKIDVLQYSMKEYHDKTEFDGSRERTLLGEEGDVSGCV